MQVAFYKLKDKAAKEKMLVNMTQDLFTIQALADKDAEREERKQMYALDI